MTALLLVALVVGFLLVAVLIYLLGFRLGGQSGISELQRVRAEAAEAERQLHDLTRSRRSWRWPRRPSAAASTSLRTR